MARHILTVIAGMSVVIVFPHTALAMPVDFSGRAGDESGRALLIAPKKSGMDLRIDNLSEMYLSPNAATPDLILGNPLDDETSSQQRLFGPILRSRPGGPGNLWVID